jgi:transposase
MGMRKSRLSTYKQVRLIEHFVSGSTARTAAELVNVNKTTAAYYFHRLREIIALETQNRDVLSGEFEVDESYFGGRRKGHRGRGAAGKVSVFGIHKHGGKVYTQVIPDASGRTLIPLES